MTENDMTMLYCKIDDFYHSFIKTNIGKKVISHYNGRRGPKKETFGSRNHFLHKLYRLLYHCLISEDSYSLSSSFSSESEFLLPFISSNVFISSGSGKAPNTPFLYFSIISVVSLIPSSAVKSAKE